MSSDYWSAIISGIALVAAVVSPVITALVNNKHQLQLKNIEYYSHHRATAIENYIYIVGQICSETVCEPYLSTYGRISKEIYLYLPQTFWKEIDDIDNLIQNQKFRDASSLLSELCKRLNECHPRPINNKRNKNYK